MKAATEAVGYVGWVERSDTHRWSLLIDGYRCAQPILRVLKRARQEFKELAG